MPRCRHDNVRAVHKQARTVMQAGHEIVLVVKDADVDQYLGMRVIAAHAPFDSVLRPIMNLPVMLAQILKLQGDIYVLRNPDTIPLALLLGLLGRRVVYDTDEDFSKRPLIRDDLPKWSRPVVAWLITILERLLARTTDRVIVTQAQLPRKLGGRTLLQPNAPLTRGPVVKAAHAANISTQHDELSLIYVGGISQRRGIFSMLEMVERMNRHLACRLELLGWFQSEQLQAQATRHHGWRFVNFHGGVSHAEALAHIMRSDIGLAILEPVADYPTSSITKLFEYMQFGVPFIASDFPAWRVSTVLGPPGLYVNPNSADDLLAAGLRLASDRALCEQMGDAGKHYIASEFNWERTSQSFLQLVARLIGDEEKLQVQQQ